MENSEYYRGDMSKRRSVFNAERKPAPPDPLTQGSGFARPRSSQQQGASRSKPKGKAVMRVARGSTPDGAVALSSDSESDDELDTLSPRKVKKTRDFEGSMPRLPNAWNQFGKIPKKGSSGSQQSSQPASQSQSRPKSPTKPPSSIFDDNDGDDLPDRIDSPTHATRRPPPADSSKRQSTEIARPKPKKVGSTKPAKVTSSEPKPGPSKPRNDLLKSKPEPKSQAEPPKPKPERPKPRPVRKPKPPESGSDSSLVVTNSRPAPAARGPAPLPVSPPSSTDKGKQKAAPAPHPFLGSTKDKAKQPLKSSTQFKQTSLPTPSSSQSSLDGGKSKPTQGRSRARRVVSSEEPSEDEEKGRKPAPFPVNLSPIKAAAAPKPATFPLSPPKRAAKPKPAAFPVIFSPGHKRMSDSSDGERSSKKMRQAAQSSPALPNIDDTVCFDSPDPDTLCPFCDKQLPTNPTSVLRKLLKLAIKRSRPCPRPLNPNGRQADLVDVFVPVCQRHRFESELLPEAEAKGWPKEIEFDRVEKRVKQLRDDLKDLITDPEIRTNNRFWVEIMSEIKKKGALGATKMQNQFANFDKTQPGYYGEQGAAVIQNTLYNMFPPSMMDQNAIKPISPADFISRVLVPEAALCLIAEDCKTHKSQALKILRESSAYGAAMFPADDGSVKAKKRSDDDDEMDVADRIMLKRAMKRRAEIKVEEAVERKVEADKKRARRPKPKLVKNSKTNGAATTDGSDAEMADLDAWELGSDVEDNKKASGTWSRSMLDNGDSSDDDGMAADLPWSRSKPSSPKKRNLSRFPSLEQPAPKRKAQYSSDGFSEHDEDAGWASRPGSSKNASPKKASRTASRNPSRSRSSSVEVVDATPKKLPPASSDMEQGSEDTPRPARRKKVPAYGDVGQGSFRPLLAAAKRVPTTRFPSVEMQSDSSSKGRSSGMRSGSSTSRRVPSRTASVDGDRDEQNKSDDYDWLLCD